MSVAGGVANAVERAVVHGCEALQIFSKNANQWNGRPLEPAEIRTFRARIDETGIRPAVAHVRGEELRAPAREGKRRRARNAR